MICKTCNHNIFEFDLTLAKFDMLAECCKDTIDNMRHEPDPYASGKAAMEAGTHHDCTNPPRDAAW